MESGTTKKELKFSEVYVSDIKILKTIFDQVSDINSTDQKSFGVPYLIAKKGDEIIAFASLIADQNHKINLGIYDNGNLDNEDKKEFSQYSSDFLKEKKEATFNNAELLIKNTERISQWLNF
ncbi:hypothetical protein [Flavobacterium ajazii]|uniref:hypothetical protein n=1 Tax=Flavobacterium ajazii TaxID=2692318 RepID=UPI0013D4F1B4|nr:hypothetical protein [Flavobacterium ajazii]